MFAVPPNTVALPALPTGAHPGRLAAEIARDRRRWDHLLRYQPDQRYAVRVESAGDAETGCEVWLLSWLPGQQTDRHDHAGSAGAFAVVSGTLTESVLRPGRLGDLPVVTTHVLTAGQCRVFGAEHAHQVGNVGADPAVSIHVYRPVRAMRPRY